MRIEIRSDSVLLDGYVNAVGRDSRPLYAKREGKNVKCVEQIEPRAFERALGRAENIDLLLDHDESRKLGSTSEGNLELFEDNIGLRAICTVKDAEVIQKAKEGKLKGWSFGQCVQSDVMEERADDIPRRIVKELDIFEVSIIDNRMNPCYIGTSIEQRAEGNAEERYTEFRAVTETFADNGKVAIDYSEFEKRMENLKPAK